MAARAAAPPPLQKTAIDGLQVLTAGPIPGNPVALLSTKRLGERLAELAALADYVLVDAPPVLAVTDAALWASQVDGVVLLVNAGSTKRIRPSVPRRFWKACRRICGRGAAQRGIRHRQWSIVTVNGQ